MPKYLTINDDLQIVPGEGWHFHSTVILRNRVRRDGYDPKTDEVYDALQAIRLVRAYAKEWSIDPHKIGIMGFSAGAELSAPAAVLFSDFDTRANTKRCDPHRGALR